ncbi:MMPL family transporter [Janibacter limosus]|uniref:MMPL family transporter n=1 Tax=Janibacter limosus TaxID=53458 RepID=A0AC61U0K4_9MICO|nr:MMPL family transporter [Janibacter limosus]UUZ43546.1 MMPL family transporter [Janibacter limosus]
MSVSSEMKIEGTEAQTVLDRVADELPAASGGRASVVFTAPDGERLDTPDRLAVISGTVGDVYDTEKVVNPPDAALGTGEQGGPGTPQEDAPADPPAGSDRGQAPSYQPLVVDGTPVPGVLVSTDGQVALFQFQFTVASTSLTADDVTSVVEVVERAEEGTGITVLPSDSLKAIEIPVGIGEVVGLAVAAPVLVLTPGSLIAAGLPLITALVGVGIGVGGAARALDGRRDELRHPRARSHGRPRRRHRLCAVRGQPAATADPRPRPDRAGGGRQSGRHRG